MNNGKKVRFFDLFSYPIYKQDRVFDLFKIPFYQFVIYFLIINLFMLLPLSISVIYMRDIDYGRFGMDFHENIPAWLPDDLPNDCRILNQELYCETNEVFEYEITNRDQTYKVYLNVSDNVSDAYLNEELGTYAIILQESRIVINLDEGQRFVLTYSGFEPIDFAEIKQLDQEEAAYLFFDGLYRSLQPFMILPLLLYSVGGMILLNALYIVIIAGAAMIFKLSVTPFLTYKNMLKLFILAATVPAIVNFSLGVFGLSPFTSIVFNFLTPVIALVFYRKNDVRLLENKM
ncbi:MAG: DUF1189 family protein [Candidatus Izemoplasmataceae bacterium]|jgi:maltodextrin utilization protein YvdJ